MWDYCFKPVLLYAFLFLFLFSFLTFLSILLIPPIYIIICFFFLYSLKYVKFTDMNANKSLKFEEIGNDIRIDAGTLNELVDHVITGNAGNLIFSSFLLFLPSHFLISFFPSSLLLSPSLLSLFPSK